MRGALKNLFEKIYKAKRCSQCFYSGYKGRLPIFGVLKMGPEIINLTIEKADVMKIDMKRWYGKNKI